MCGISTDLDGCGNHFIQVQEELPLFELPYGMDGDNKDPFVLEMGSSDDNLDDEDK